MNIGIILAYMPGTKLGSEGLGRYIGNLIKGFTDDHNSVTIVCPIWLEESLYDIFEDFHVSKDLVEISISQNTPILWRLYEYKFKSKEKFKWKNYVYRGLSDIIDISISFLLEITSTFLFVLLNILIIAIILTLFPLVIAATVLFILIILVRNLFHKNINGMKSIFDNVNIIHQNFSKTKENIEVFAYYELNKQTVLRIVQKANSKNVDVWFVPTLFWPDAVKIKATTVFTVPDLVTTEFPYPFAGSPGSVKQTKTCISTVERGKYFITYGDFIKRDVLQKRYGKDDEHVISISHVNNTSLPYLQITNKDVFHCTSIVDVQNTFNRELLKRLPKYSVEKDFLEGMDFDNVKYIFYASQQRPHKNILNLLRAYEYLLREKEVEFKLFLTCDLQSDIGLSSFIQNHHLQHHVISFQRVPVQLLSALYACAELVVSPTLYEGAFLTFTIGEGMSVGTPCIMGRIPQVTDMIPKVYPLDHILFDPLNYLDIAHHIMYGIENKEKLYQDELPMYKDIEARTGEIVSRDYVEAFKKFILMDKEETSIHDNK